MMNELSDNDKKLWQWAVKGNSSLKSPPVARHHKIPSREDLQKEMNDFLSSSKSHIKPNTSSEIRLSNFPIHQTNDPSFSGYFGEKSEIKLDLHGLTQELAYSLLKKNIKYAHQHNIRYVLIITGKGKGEFCEDTKKTKYHGTLLSNVPRWLESYPFKQWIETTQSVPASMGGEGALKIIIKRKNKIA